MNPIVIQIVPLKEKSEELIFSYTKNKQYDNTKIDSRPDGRESKLVKELV